MDTDAYVHHTISRQIIMSPKDLSIHWVWLPLFHYISAGAVLIGADMNSIRFANIFIWAAIPVLLFIFLFNQNKEKNLFIAFFSSLICALFPIGILMGTTAQPEPLFALLVLLFIIAINKNKFILSSIILTSACLLRYEAWAVLFAYIIIYVGEIFENKKFIFNGKILNILIPGFAILLWAILREPFDGKIFGFLFQTQKFANDALKESNSFQGGIIKILWDFIHYPVIIPVLFMGINMIFVPFGFKSLYKQNKIFVYSSISILLFITASWMLKSNLGLNRHFVSLIPFYATLTAFGFTGVCDFLKNSTDKLKIFKSINLNYTLLILSLLSCLIYLIMWLYIWTNNFKEGFPEKKVTAEYLKKFSDEKTIFCNDAIVEIFSEIDYNKFNHTWMENNPGAADLILQTAKKEGTVYVVISEEKWININNIGNLIYSSSVNKETNNRILILKLTGR